MEILLNGKTITTKSTTLSQFIAESGFDTRALIAEVNLKVVKEKDWSETRIHAGDRIELLSFVGGG